MYRHLGHSISCFLFLIYFPFILLNYFSIQSVFKFKCIFCPFTNWYQFCGFFSLSTLLVTMVTAVFEPVASGEKKEKKEKKYCFCRTLFYI